VAALCRNYRGSALLQLGDLSGRDELLRSMAQATGLGNHEYVMRAYYNLIEGLWRLGEYREALGYLEQGENFGRDRDFRVYGYMFAARRARLALMRGQWAQAEAGLRELLEGQHDPGMIGRETVPVLARVLVRQAVRTPRSGSRTRPATRPWPTCSSGWCRPAWRTSSRRG